MQEVPGSIPGVDPRIGFLCFVLRRLVSYFSFWLLSLLQHDSNILVEQVTMFRRPLHWSKQQLQRLLLLLLL